MKLDYLDNVKIKGDVSFGNYEGYYIADKSTGIIVAFRCPDCGYVFTLDEEDECLVHTCKECAKSEIYEDLKPAIGDFEF